MRGAQCETCRLDDSDAVRKANTSVQVADSTLHRRLPSFNAACLSVTVPSTVGELGFSVTVPCTSLMPARSCSATAFIIGPRLARLKLFESICALSGCGPVTPEILLAVN